MFVPPVSEIWTKTYGPIYTKFWAFLQNKVALEPQVSPENKSKYVDTVTVFAKTWTKGHWPLDDPTSVEVLCVTLPKDHCVQVPLKYIKVRGYCDLFCKKLERSLTPRWLLTPHLLRSHVWLSILWEIIFSVFIITSHRNIRYKSWRYHIKCSF